MTRERFKDMGVQGEFVITLPIVIAAIFLELEFWVLLQESYCR